MKSVVIGLGYFGKIIKNKISKHYFENLSNRFNHEIITVDPYNKCADYKSIDDINYEMVNGLSHHPQTHTMIYLLNSSIKVLKIFGWKNLYALHT